jgi:hypothetical protein
MPAAAGSWPTLAQDRRNSRPARKPAEKTQLPAISATEAHLQLIRKQIQELEQARKLGKAPASTLRKHVEKLSLKPGHGKPLDEVTRLYAKSRTASAREEPEPAAHVTDRSGRIQGVAAEAAARNTVRASARAAVTTQSASQPAVTCTSVVPFVHKPAVFGALRLGGSFDTLEKAAFLRRDRTSHSKELDGLRCQRLFDGITWPAGPLNEDMRRSIGKWVRGTLSGPQCRVCLDFLGWPQPFGVDASADVSLQQSTPVDYALPILAGMPMGPEKGSDELDYLFSKGANDIINEAYQRCASVSGEVAYVEQIWLACRTLARRTFARCLQSEHPRLPAYRTEEIMCEALRQKLVGEGLKPEGAWLRHTLVRKGLEGLEEKPPPKSGNEELEMYHRRQIYLRKELQRQFNILGKEEAYTLFGVTDDAPLSPKSLKRQYRQMALECHPDKGGDMHRFHRLQAAYNQLSSAAASGQSKANNERLVSRVDAEGVRQKVLQIHSCAEACAAAIQRLFIQQSRGMRFKDWIEIVQQAVLAAQTAGETSVKVSEEALELIDNVALREASGLPDAAEACQSAGSDTQSLAARTTEAAEESMKMNPTDRRLIQVSQQRILALVLHAGLAAIDAGMSASEVGHCIQWAKKPEEKTEEPDSPVQAPPPPEEPLGRTPRSDEETPAGPSSTPKKSADKGKGKKADPPKEEPVSTEHKELITRVSALNTDLLNMQQQLHTRLTNTGLEASAASKEKVFGLVAAFMDESCVEFAKRLQAKVALSSCIESTFWWLMEANNTNLAVPPGVQAVVLRSALGLDTGAVKTMVTNELLPRIWQMAAKLRGRRMSNARAGALVLAPEDEAAVVDCQDRILRWLQPRSCT